MSDRVIRIGEASAKPGTRANGYLPVEGLPQEAAIPITIVNGAHAGPTLTITGGIHGGEYPGVDAAGKFADSLDPAGVHGAVVVSRVSNPTAFHARTVYICPLDGKNLNRQFPGDHAGTASQKIAATIFDDIISAGDAFIDLHGGDLVESLTPFAAYHVSGNAQVDARSRELALAFGIHFVSKGTTVGSTYSAAARAGIPSILAESGHRGLREEDAVERHLVGLNNVARHLGIIDEPPTTFDDLVELESTVGLRSEHKGFFYPTVEHGQQVEQGQVVGYINDYFGNRLQTYEAPISGPVIYVVTSLATNPGDPLMSIGRVPE